LFISRFLLRKTSALTLTLALAAAHEAAHTQHHPGSVLYVVGTPIGNLADMSLRALHVLSLCDAVACEDTRHTRSLLQHYGLDKPLLAVHEHNEQMAAEQVIARLQNGERVAYVSDAGTPAVSDPGARLVAAVQAAGLKASPLPGTSSVTAVLSVAGVVSQSAPAHSLPGVQNGFVFVGFLSSKASERQAQVLSLLAEPRTVVLLEAPHRVAALAQSLHSLGERQVTVGRELTKQFEQVVTLRCDELPTWLDAAPMHSRGEFVLVLHSLAAVATATDRHDAPLRLLMEHLPLKTAVTVLAQISGAARNALYERALALQKKTD
jgi:16S rRNA (cytidine1402-2'-O)-methyltransferase